jgi:cobalt/nickel transport protein
MIMDHNSPRIGLYPKKGGKFMKKWLFIGVMGLFLLSLHSQVLAQFALIIPSDSMVMEEEDREVKLTLSYSHPFEGKGMDLSKPSQFGVKNNRWKKSLVSNLEKIRIMGYEGWEVVHRLARSGVYIFYMELEPLWVPDEDRFISHYAKTVTAVSGSEEGWDETVDLTMEIVPLTRPFGLYTGNVFQGVVMLDKKPLPFAKVEITYYNINGKAAAPTDFMITQVVKTDINGVFTYAAPRAGWWGFMARNTSLKMKRGGDQKDLELRSALWVEFCDWKEE